MTPVWVREAADRFWGTAARPPFPRDLQAAIVTVARLPVVRRTRLRLDTVREYLARVRILVPIDEPDRPLRACLFCDRGAGFLFLDDADPPDEQRFSLAHELAHFLRDYAGVRRQVERALGPAALEVLDGRRPPTPAEQLHAVLRNVPVGPHFHLMERDAGGRPKSPVERDAERRADRLAFELLAPADLLAAETDRTAVVTRLVGEFGLPPQQAIEYAAVLLPAEPDAGGLVGRLQKFW